MWIIWLLVSAALATFVVYTAFLALCTAKRMIASGVSLPADLKLTCYLWLLIGWPADFVYNLLRGTLRHLEWPHELTYSARVQRLARKGDKEAIEWARLLNAGDEDHVKL